MTLKEALLKEKERSDRKILYYWVFYSYKKNFFSRGYALRMQACVNDDFNINLIDKKYVYVGDFEHENEKFPVLCEESDLKHVKKILGKTKINFII